MKHSLTALALLGCSVLAGCGTENRGLASVHQPVVARTDYVYDMPAPTNGLGASDDRALTGWFESLSLRYGDRISVDTQGYGPDARDAVSAVVARYGLLVDAMAPITQGDVPAGSIRVIVSRMSASVPNCPDWSRPASPNFDGHALSNYGCATNGNLAAMVADPRDLISGRTGATSPDGATAAKAIRTYRNAVPTGAGGLKSEATKGK
jgi:pilus assembly protein CpaD